MSAEVLQAGRNPLAILDAKAIEMYNAWRNNQPRGAFWNPFIGAEETPASWDQISNHEREVWREKALAALRSDESVLDELKREDRERRRLVSVQRPNEAPPDQEKP
jgi:hypothetical protein